MYEYKELDNKTRTTLPGKFIQLSSGIVHFELDGPVEGVVIVLVHGFSSPLVVWDHTFEMLVEEGFRVLRYDLYGRGYSDRPQITYNMDLFVNQLLKLVEQLGLTQKKINLVGLSMGGGICVVFADKYPDLIHKISLIDPIGFPIDRNLLLSILKIPILNKLILRSFFRHKKLIESQKQDFHEYERIDEYLEKYAEQMKYSGFLQAIHSTVINTPFTNLKEIYEQLGKRKLPMQLFWGENDLTIPYSTSKKVCLAVPSIEFHTIKKGGHLPHYTHPDEVNPLLIKFLQD